MMMLTHEQDLLLRVALKPCDDSALNAWQEWKSRVDVENSMLDMGSYRLLPMVYHNLKQLGVEDPLMKKLKGIRRREWYRNQMLFHTISDVLRLFHERGIETILLKGAALVLAYYKDYGLRPMDDFDVLVPTEKRVEAINLLTQAGWHPKLCSLDELFATIISTRHGWGFENAQHRKLDLHWHVLQRLVCKGNDDDFWAAAAPVWMGELPAKVLCPADQLLHVCVHGAVWNHVPQIRWIPDAMMILNKSDSQMDWERLIAKAKQRHLILYIDNALTYLRDSFGASIPPYVFEEIGKAPVSNIERKRHQKITGEQGALGALPKLWYRYAFELEMAGQTNLFRRLIGFPAFVRRNRRMDNWQFIKWASSRAMVRIGKTMQRMG